MMRIETTEEGQVWLATYKAGLRARAKVASAIEVADSAVEAWRERMRSPDTGDVVTAAKVMADQAETLQRLAQEAQRRSEELTELRAKVAEAEGWKREAALLRGLRDEAWTLLDAVRLALKTPSVADEGLPAVVTGIVAATAALREEADAILGALPPGSGTVVERVRELLKSIARWQEKGDIWAHERDSHFEDKRRLIAERDRLQQDVFAMEERLRALEASSAACHQDLAAVRVALGAHNSPERSVAECVAELSGEKHDDGERAP